MDITLKLPDSLAVPAVEMQWYKMFLQLMTNRRGVGYLRYGKINRRAGYMSRMKKELEVYEKDGNMEQLLNIAVYAFLESYTPQNKKFHFDNNVKSVTRK